MRRNCLKLCVFIIALTITACGDDNGNHGIFDEGPGNDTTGQDGAIGDTSQGQDTNVNVSACLPAWGTDGSTTVQPTTAQTFATVEDVAMNQMDNQSSPLPYTRMGALALGTGDCASAGLLWMDPNVDGSSSRKLMYQDVTTVGLRAATPAPEVVVDWFSPATHNATLFWATACMPIAMRPTSTGYMEYDRDEGAVWAGETINVANAPAVVTGLTGMGGWQEADGTMVVVARATVDGNPKGIVGRRAFVPFSTWTFTTFDMPPQYTDLFALRAAADGTLHALYSKTEYPCDPCDMDLYYGRMNPEGDWIEETVQESKWGDPDDEYATDPTMVLDSRGEPIVAANFLTRAITGSTRSSELRVYGRDNGEWCMEEVATEVDGYRGSDGTDMTGAAPFVALDGAGRVHVVFQDMAQWHDANNYANAVNGQIRYAVRAGKNWTLSTLVEQEGEGTAAPVAPLNGMLPTMLAVSADGQTVYAAGASFGWETNSIYLTEDVPIIFKATVVRADVTLP